ncbi:cation-translocating P-type ATPase [Fibrella aquatilis]|uniref:Cation-translocating P-type ATPase n=1 Tax=Fibrella aquatilis TaxID=2817059 RepID=A0A939G4X8_9BACT|nr:cation-translocating P-type ATPase [Fibrella aquatilis]MBO0930302.1 cation-translocating P-type ATPase [Fibrella aquatilis]
MNYYATPVAEVARSLATSPDGLDADTARQRLGEYGPNQLQDAKKKTAWAILFSQFADVMILVLIAATIISGLMGDYKSAGVILAIVVLNATIGFFQENQAQKAMNALKKMAPNRAQVQRNGLPVQIAATDLVPGDVILLEAGNSIPADVRFLDTHALKVDESSLTGESATVEKSHAVLPEGDYSLGDRLNLGYKGTFVTNGRATAYVVATGMNTELGQIAKLVQTDETATPLQKRLATFGMYLAVGALGICLLFFGVGWLRGEPLLNLLMVSISLAVAAIPEALPAVVTVALALGASRLVKSKALVRKLSAVETLGSVTYICTDKTGTLTLNKMTVEASFEAPPSPAIFGADNGLLLAMALNNDVVKNTDGDWTGEATEVALARYAAEKAYERLPLTARFPRIAELPFDSERKCMTTLHQTEAGVLVVTKGAVGALVKQLDKAEAGKVPDLLKRVDTMAEKGFRTLGYAARLLPQLPTDVTPQTIETGLTFVGFAGLIDPPRPEAKRAVAMCRTAGITTVMITGDHKLTAKAIAESLGIITSPADLVLTGPELTKLDDEAFAAIVAQVRVYARVDPAQKLRIISALQAQHQYVAMTGDGVNDAPALKNADIGIAMGINGTEVAKEAAHLILLDDNFATIVKAVRHGRRIYDNILKFIRYILSGNAGEIWAIFLAPLLGLPIPLLAIHILWVNLVTDGLPGLALAYEPAEKNVMQRPPVSPAQTIFGNGLGWFVLWVGLLIGAVTIGVQAWAIHQKLPHWQTMVFTVLCFSQLGNAAAIRSQRSSFFSVSLLVNKPMLGALLVAVVSQLLIIYVPIFNRLFNTQPLSWSELGITVVAASLVFWAVELQKLVTRHRPRAKTKAQIRHVAPELAAV